MAYLEEPTPKIRIDQQNRVTKIALKLEPYKSLFTSSSVRVFETGQHFIKLCLHLQSYRDILQVYGKGDYTDVSCLAAIARMVVESHAAIRYFSQRQIPSAELDFRIAAANYHHHFDTNHILSLLGFDNSDGLTRLSSHFKGQEATDLKNNPFFATLPKAEQDSILRGEKPYPYKFKYTKTFPFPKNADIALYRLLSSFIHSLPSSSAFTRDYSSKHHFGFINMIYLTNEVVIAYASSSLQSYCSLRSRLASKLSKNERLFIKLNCAFDNIQAWIDHRKNLPMFF